MKIKDIGTVVTGKTPATSHTEYYDGDYMFVTPNELHGGYKVSSSEKTITDEGIKSIKSNTIDGISVLVGCIGWDMGNVAMCFEKCATNQQINSITKIRDCFNPYYLYYWLSTKKDFLFSIASVTRTPILSKGVFEEIEIPNTDRLEQDKISKMLLLLDQKIEYNAAVNDNLEAVLAASHSKMFFSKDTSEHSKLGELMTFGNGKSRPKTDGPIPVYGGNGVLSYTDHHNIENAVLIGRVGAYCGSVYLEQGICWVSDNAIFAKSKITKDEFFDYFLLKRLNLFNHHVGTGQQLLTQEILNNIEVPKPVTEQIELFNRKATSIFETIFTNSREIIRLQELSDLLLSRLAG